MAFALCPVLTAGATEALRQHGSEELKAALFAEPRQRRVDRHDEPDRTASGIGSRSRAHEGRAGGRSLSPLRPEDLHHVGRPRHDGQRDSSRPRAHAGCARGRTRHLAVPRAQVPAQRRRVAGAAQRCSLRFSRTQAGHPRESDLRDELRRQGRRDWLSGRTGEQGPRAHVHDDERSAPEGGDPGARDRGTRVSASPRVCEGARSGTPLRQAARAARSPSFITRTSGACC